MNMDTPMPVLRTIARRFAQIQRLTWSCCGVASETPCLLLTELLQTSGLSIRDLAQRIGSDPPWVSRVVEEMRAQGLVERHPDRRDRRQVQVSLTAPGKQEATALQIALNRQAEDLLSGLSPDRRGVALEVLTWVADALEAEYAALTSVVRAAPCAPAHAGARHDHNP